MIRAVILAAGDGGRLSEYTADVPKPLVQVNGRPLIGYTIDALADAGIEEAIVVVGYRAAQVVQALEGSESRVRLSFARNGRFHGGASLSLRAARTLAGDSPFLLLMADHLLSAPIVRTLAESPRDGRTSLIATDASQWPDDYAEEATRVSLIPGRRAVDAIGKGLARWDALDTGAFLLSPAAWEAVDSVAEDCELSVICSELARRGELEAVDVSGEPWYDVDTAEDLLAARQMVAGGAR